MVQTDETSLTIRRTFDAPRERVWAAWTDPEQVAQWWGPEGFTTTVHEMDVSPAGDWRYVMHGPDGTDYENHVVYDEVREPERLVYAHGTPDDPELFRVTVTFDERAGGTTELTVRQEYESAAALNESIEEFGADEGLVETMDRLADHVASAEVA